MPMSRKDYFTVSQFGPPALITEIPPELLKPEQSPACHGVDLDDVGYLSAGSIPTGSAEVFKTYSSISDGNSASNYTWHFNRLWRLDDAAGAGECYVRYGAVNYNNFYYRQGHGAIQIPEATDLIAILPLGVKSLLVVSDTGANIIYEANDYLARFQVSPHIEELKGATSPINIDGVVYFLKGSRLFSVDEQQKTTEESLPIRGTSLSGTLTADFVNKRVIVGTSYVYDIATKTWFDYSTSGFSFTSRTVGNKGKPFCVNRILLEIEHTLTADAEITWSTKFGNREWRTQDPIQIRHDDSYIENLLTQDLIERETAIDFTVRIDSLPSGVKIRNIMISAEGLMKEAYAA